ncbi:GNAT family N-acetyltransferase, partial [Streptosporangium algeriense]
MNVRVEHRERLADSQVAAVLALAEAAAEADGVGPLNEQALLRLRHGGEKTRSVLLYAGGDLAGYAHVDLTDQDAPGGELVVHPAFRRRGHGRRLLLAVLEKDPRLRPGEAMLRTALQRVAQG